MGRRVTVRLGDVTVRVALNDTPAARALVDDERNSLRYGDQLTIGRIEGPLDSLRTLDGRLDAVIDVN